METSKDFLNNISPPVIINTGKLSKTAGGSVPYTLELGLSVSSIRECNRWKDYVNEFVVDYIYNNPKIENPREILRNKIMLEDSHWNWFGKAYKHQTAEYNWFFLKTKDGVQGACLTYHPKDSVFQKANIFYIKYIASAP